MSLRRPVAGNAEQKPKPRRWHRSRGGLEKAKALLAVNGFTSPAIGSGETRTLVAINRTSYTVGDTLSLTTPTFISPDIGRLPV